MSVSQVQSLPPRQVNTPVAGNWGYTELNVVKCSYLWTIKNFSLCQDDEENVLESSVFPSEGDVLKWCIHLWPMGVHKRTKHFLSLFLCLVSCSKPPVVTKFKLSILNDKREEIKSRKFKATFIPEQEWGFRKFVRRDFLFNKANCILPEDKLTIFCEMSVMVDSVDISGQSKFKMPECRMSDNLGSIFKSQKFSDVTLSVPGREFQAHKIILATHSAVFAAMFKHDMKESRHNRVEITDVDHDVMQEMLYFMYTGKTGNLDKVAFDLLAAADKYALERLKVMCEEALCANLSIENAADIFFLADQHSAEQLKTQAVIFICTHATHVMETSGWKSMIHSHPHVYKDACRSLAIHKSPISVTHEEHEEELMFTGILPHTCRKELE